MNYRKLTSIPIQSIVKALQQNENNISKTLRSLDVPTNDSRIKRYMARVRDGADLPYSRKIVTQQILQELVPVSRNWSDLCVRIGLTTATANFKRMQRLCKEFGISHDHFIHSSLGLKVPKYTAETALVEESTISRSALNSFLKRLGLYKDNCEICRISEWNGGPLPMELDHKNGNNRDNRIENLQWICPNCHSLTSTYKGKNRRNGAPARNRT